MTRIDLPYNLNFKEGLKMIAELQNVSIEELLLRMGLPTPNQYNQEKAEVTTNVPSLNEAILIYKNSTKYEKLALSGRPSYDTALKQFEAFLVQTVYKNIPEEQQKISIIKQYMVEDFLNSFEKGKKIDSKFSIRTRNKKLAAIRALFQTLQDKELLSHNPVKKIIYEKPSKLKADYLTPEQQQKGLDLSRTGYFGTRNFTMFYFLLNSGARMEGMINLNWTDVNFNEGSLILKEKGNKERNIPLVDGLAEQLIYYRNVYSDIFDKNPKGPVFINLRGTTRGSRITEDAIRSVMGKIYSELGFDDCCLHRTRRTYALNCLEAGMSLPEIRDLLGHENCSTTEEYLRLSDVHLREVMKRHFPFAIISYRKANELGWDK